MERARRNRRNEAVYFLPPIATQPWSNIGFTLAIVGDSYRFSTLSAPRKMSLGRRIFPITRTPVSRDHTLTYRGTLDSRNRDFGIAECFIFRSYGIHNFIAQPWEKNQFSDSCDFRFGFQITDNIFDGGNSFLDRGERNYRIAGKISIVENLNFRIVRNFRTFFSSPRNENVLVRNFRSRRNNFAIAKKKRKKTEFFYRGTFKMCKTSISSNGKIKFGKFTFRRVEE